MSATIAGRTIELDVFTLSRAGKITAMSEHGATGGSTRVGDEQLQTEDQTHVRVRRDDLLVVLGAAQQLHGTPLITAREHERLGRAINTLRGQLAPQKPFSKRTRLRP